MPAEAAPAGQPNRTPSRYRPAAAPPAAGLLPSACLRAACLLAACLLSAGLLVAACGQVVHGKPVALSPLTADRSLIVSYFEHSNAAAQDGSAAQKQFLDSTQHPDVPERCDLGELTLRLDPTLSTLRSDGDWRPAGADHAPRGRVYVIAVTVTVQRDRTALATQVGSMHLVVLDGAAFGFAPCPT